MHDKVFLDSKETFVQKPSSSICGPISAEESSGDGGPKENALAIVTVQKTEAASSTTTLSVRELPELKPGWPLLQRTILSDRQSPDGSLAREISVVQWAMQLPCRNLSFVTDHDQSIALDGESGALVPVNVEMGTADSSPDWSMPKELEDLHDRCSSTCRLFEYRELLLATSNFSPGMLQRKSLL